MAGKIEAVLDAITGVGREPSDVLALPVLYELAADMVGPDRQGTLYAGDVYDVVSNLAAQQVGKEGLDEAWLGRMSQIIGVSDESG